MEPEQEKARRTPIHDYRDLRAWQLSRHVVKAAYELTRRFPREEVYGLVQQMQRASVSIASNIAEGYGRGSLGDYIRFLLTARGSLYELETQCVLAEDLEFVTPRETTTLRARVEECARVLQGLINSLQAKGTARRR